MHIYNKLLKYKHGTQSKHKCDKLHLNNSKTFEKWSSNVI